MAEEVIDVHLANQLCFAVYDANRLFNKFYQTALAPFKLTYPQYIVLIALWESDHQALKELGDKLSLGSNTLTPLLKRLEDSGWIIREHPEEDKRQLLIHLSEKGRQKRNAVLTAVAECVGKQQLDVAAYEESLATLQMINQGLQKTIEQLK